MNKHPLYSQFSKAFFSIQLILFFTFCFSTEVCSQSIIESDDAPFLNHDYFFHQRSSLSNSLLQVHFESGFLIKSSVTSNPSPQIHSFHFSQVFIPLDLSISQNIDIGYPSDSLKFAMRENLKVALAKNDQWFGSDKVKHFGVSFLLTLAGYYSSKAAFSFNNQDAMLPAAGVSLLIGFGKEFADDLSPTNIFSLKDLFADVVGIISAILLLSIIH